MGVWNGGSGPHWAPPGWFVLCAANNNDLIQPAAPHHVNSIRYAPEAGLSPPPAHLALTLPGQFTDTGCPYAGDLQET